MLEFSCFMWFEMIQVPFEGQIGEIDCLWWIVNDVNSRSKGLRGMF